jgi:hypothetical protein
MARPMSIDRNARSRVPELKLSKKCVNKVSKAKPFNE